MLQNVNKTIRHDGHGDKLDYKLPVHHFSLSSLLNLL